MSHATTSTGAPAAAASAVRSPCRGPRPSSASATMRMPGNHWAARASLATTSCRSVAPRNAASTRSAIRSPSTSARPFGIPRKRRAAPPARSTPTHRIGVIPRSDAQAAVLGGEIELRRERALDDEALDPAAWALLQESAAPVAHHQVVADVGVGDARDRRLVHRATAQAALVRRAPLRIAARAHERASGPTLAQGDVREAAAAWADDARPLAPDR